MHSTRHSITVATAGHVDHGKSSLVTHITGTETDTLADEKSRGLSINLGFAYYSLPQTDTNDSPALTVGFVDVPGHTDFINNALAGIGAADFALLVVAADDGVMPQTREHLSIIHLLGIHSAAVALTKIDMVDTDQLDAARQQIDDLTKGTAFADAPVFPLSSKTGAGVAELVTHLETLVRSAANQSPDQYRLPRFAVDRSFTVKGIGTIVTGTVTAGAITQATTLTHSGSDQTVRIKSLRHDQLAVDQAIAGERIALNISLPHQQLSRGDWLVDNQLFIPANRLDVRLTLLDPVSFKSGVEFHLYHGTGHHLVQVRKLGGAENCFYQLFSQDSLLAHHGDRFILRDPASTQTIGGGVVVDVFVPRRGRASPERLAMLSAMNQQDYPALRKLVQIQSSGVDLNQFRTARNLSDAGLKRLLDKLSSDHVPVVRLTDTKSSQIVLLHEDYNEQASQQILKTLSDYHQSNQNEVGPAEPELSRLAAFKKSHLLFSAILENLIKAKQVVRTGTLLHLPGHHAQLSREEQEFLDTIRPILLESGFLPPRTRELAEMTGMNLGMLERVLARARKSGSLIQVATNRHYLPETIVQLAGFTESLAQDQQGGFSVIQFRDRLGIGRNLCIEILEYFDSRGFTVRKENSRHVRTSMENVFGQSTQPDAKSVIHS